MKITFKKSIKPLKDFGWDNPSTIYTISESEISTPNIQIQFVARINAKIIIGESTYRCSPQRKNKLIGVLKQIGISDIDDNFLGNIQFLSYSDRNKRIEFISNYPYLKKWSIMEKSPSIFKREFWTKSCIKINLVSDDNIITLTEVESETKKSLLSPKKVDSVTISFNKKLQDMPLLAGLLIYLYEQRIFANSTS